jgi:hypothetical protein
MASTTSITTSSQTCFLGIGHPVPFSFFGTAVSLIVFVIILVFVASLKDIIEAQDLIW